MIRRPAGRFGSNPIKPQSGEVEFVNEGIDRPNWIVRIYPILQTFGKQRRLPPIDPLNEAPHSIPPQIAAESYSANQKTEWRFYTGWVRDRHLTVSASRLLTPQERGKRYRQNASPEGAKIGRRSGGQIWKPIDIPSSHNR